MKNKNKVGKENGTNSNRDKSDVNMTITEAEEDEIDAANNENVKKKFFCSIMWSNAYYD